MKMAMRLKWVPVRWMCLIFWVGAGIAFAQNPSDQPAAALADQIAGILGPGQAKLTIRNLSTVPVDVIPSIRKALEQDLKSHGVLPGGGESANQIRVTLSENSRERIWVAEVVQGNETQVAMVHLPTSVQVAASPKTGLLLRSQTVFTSRDPLLAVLETQTGIIALEPEQVVLFTQSATGWNPAKRLQIGSKRPQSRDPRGELVASAEGAGFQAFLGGIECNGRGTEASSDVSIQCRESDDPWPLVQGGNAIGSPALGAFFNANRNYFTGVFTPALGVDLAPFYTAALIPRPVGGSALVIGGVDGKVRMIDNGALKDVSGTRDWGSDFATLRSGCGGGTQIVTSSSGEAASDSLRAYELPALEVVPASPPLAMDGSIIALWTAPDGKTALALVHTIADQYEVDSVSALCN